MFNILIVEDDTGLNRLIRTVLEKNGYAPVSAFNGAEGMEKFENQCFDLIISDIMMPAMDGFEFAAAVRRLNKNVPILFVTAKDAFDAKERSFKLGIDDYMVKPVDVKELLLRVGALLRRAKIVSEHKLAVGNTRLDYDSLTVEWDGTAIELPQKEFFLLFKLLSYPGRIFTRSQLMDEFWGLDSESLERTVDVHITRLRDKFKNNRDFEIVTVRGLGYKAVIVK